MSGSRIWNANTMFILQSTDKPIPAGPWFLCQYRQNDYIWVISIEDGPNKRNSLSMYAVPNRLAFIKTLDPSIDQICAGENGIAKALAGGSGWTILAWSGRLGRLVNHWAADHAHALPAATPILALDM